MTATLPSSRLAEGIEMDELPPTLQAERLQLLAEVEWDDGSIPLATSYLERALEVAGDDPPLSARISARLVLTTVPGDPARALQHAERAVGRWTASGIRWSSRRC